MSPDETLPAVSSSAPEDSPGRVPAAGISNSAGLLGGNRLPPIGVLLARPLLLGLCALLGAIGGYLLTAGDQDSAATATILFATPAANRDLVALDGATLARSIAPAWVLQKAATSLGEQPKDLEQQTSVVWQQGTRLLNVTVRAETGDQAIKRANAVTDAAITASSEARNQGLMAAVQDANALIADTPLGDPDAEVARRNQIGASLAERQNQIQAESISLFVISSATEATPVGLSTTKGTVVGLVSGLFAGALLAVLMGSRGLRVPAPGAMRRLVPDVDVLSSSDLPQIAGQLVEAGETRVVVIATRGANLSALTVSEDLQRLLAAHGKSTTTASADLSKDPALTALLRADALSRDTLRGSRLDTDIVLLNVNDGTEAASMLKGRAGFSTVIVVRRRKTPLSSALAAYRSFARTRSFLVVAS
jgi:capsular polysaccharide biosynthesis protein